MKVFQEFADDDVIESNIAKGVTSALFTNDSDSTLTAFYTTVTPDSQDYFVNVYSVDPSTYTSAQPQFAIAVGDYRGYGTVTASGASDATFTPSKAVYTQFANLLLEPGDDKFTIASTDQNTMIFIIMNRARYKEKMNPGGWSLKMHKSATQTYSDDSATVPASAKNGKLVYNITSTGGDKVGLFYPEIGVIAIGGGSGAGGIDKSGNGGIGSGFWAPAANTDQDLVGQVYDEKKHVSAKHFKARAEEDITSTHYFCRVRNQDYNFSNNTTFVTTSNNLKHAQMIKDPQVYITTVGLYTEENELVAIAKLSKPLLKNFTREATVRVKLDY
jgi:hypothetical protein